jgi:hypothetical protein
MSNGDYAMLAFVKKWSQYGSGDEYIFPEFGLPPLVFYRRLSRLLEKKLVQELDMQTRVHLREFCAVKIAGYEQAMMKKSMFVRHRIGDVGAVLTRPDHQC